MGEREERHRPGPHLHGADTARVRRCSRVTEESLWSTRAGAHPLSAWAFADHGVDPRRGGPVDGRRFAALRDIGAGYLKQADDDASASSNTVILAAMKMLNALEAWAGSRDALKLARGPVVCAVCSRGAPSTCSGSSSACGDGRIVERRGWSTRPRWRA
jgi:hypothetical protein